MGRTTAISLADEKEKKGKKKKGKEKRKATFPKFGGALGHENFLIRSLPKSDRDDE